MRIVFFGSSKFSVPILKKLINSKHDVFLCVTQPDKRKGRGMEYKSTYVKKAADYNKLKTIQPVYVNKPDVINEIISLEPDAFIVASYGQILNKKLLEKVSYPIGVHPSLLPKYRGASPVSRAILNGEELTGVTIFMINEEMDAGNIIEKKVTEIMPQDNALELTEKLSRLGADLLLKVLDDIEKKDFKLIPQDENRVSYAPKLTKKDGFINWDEPAITIHDKVRAMFPWPGAYTYYYKNKEKRQLKIWESECYSSEGQFKPGEILDIIHEGIVVGTSEGSVLLKTVQDEGRQKVSSYAFVNGARLSIGDVFIVL